jgi:hypothetical protein
MKCPSVSWLAVAVAAVVASWSAQAGAADMANQLNPGYYDYGASGVGYGTAGYAPGMPGYGMPSLASYPDYGYAASGYGYPGYGYGGYGYGSNGYGGYGYGGCGSSGRGHCGRRHRCCSFSANATCCANAWDGYCDGGCGPAVKVHRRHRALGCGAGPCVDANCGRVHHCHLRRNRFLASCGMGGGCGCDGGGGMMMDQTPGQPGMSGPTPVESLQPPMPSADEPPSPGDAPST